MKKAWVFLIALALLAFSMPIFAQAPAAGSFHAWNQGNLFPYYQIGSATATWGWGPLWDAVPGIDQEWTFSYDGNNYGFNATFEFGMDQFGPFGSTAAGQPISWFATYYKFGDLVKVTIGKPRFNDYTEFSQIEGNNYKRFGDSDFMAIAQVFPVSGASIAAALYVPPLAAAANPNASDIGKNFGIAASYAMPNLLTVKVMYRAVNWSEGPLTTVVIPLANPSSIFSAGVNVSAMQGLTLNADVQADLSVSSNTVLKAFVSASTTMIAPLNLAVDVAFVNQASPSQTAYAFEVQAEYPIMGQWVIGARVGYDAGSATGVKVGWFNQGVGDWTGFEIWPYIKANFDNGSSFKIGFVYGTADSTGASNAVIAIPIIYVWSF